VSSKKLKASFKPTPVDADTASIEEDADVKSGRVRFDERGNAIWEWAMSTGAFGRDVSTARLKALDHPALAIVDDSDDPPPFAGGVRANPLGAKKGYDPYDSGKLSKAQAARKKDLRRLSEWLKLKKQAEENKKRQGEPEK
jgi:hypothetical protein